MDSRCETKKVPFFSAEIEDDEVFERLIVDELINPIFRRSVSREFSIIKKAYRSLLDPYHGKPYPLCCIGTFARVAPDYLESFVNISKLMNLVRKNTTNSNLRLLISVADDNEYRHAMRRAIHTVGDLSYNYEWTDAVTYSKIESLLEGMAAYKSRNRRVVEALKDHLVREYDQGGVVIFLDIGSGVGGTSIELFNYLEELREEGAIPQDYQERTKLVLFDLSDMQLGTAYDEITKRFDFDNIAIVQTNFRNMAKALCEYKGKISAAVSGAAICHVTQKDEFFKTLHTMMRPGGVISFWDPAISQYQAHSIVAGGDDGIRIIFKTIAGREYTVEKGELLDIKTLKKIGRGYKTVVSLPWEEVEIFASNQQLHLFQMGYSAENIGAELAVELAVQLSGDIFRDVKTKKGFDLFGWYKKHLGRNSGIPKLDRTHWTPYDLIEAVEERGAYERYIERAGFKLLESARFSDLFPGTPDFADRVTVHYLVEKGR